MHVLSIQSGRAILALVTASLVFAACSSGGGASDTTSDPASSPMVAPTADPGGGETPPASDPPATTEAATETTAGGGDTGPAAAPGEGRLEVGGKTYALTIAECKFRDDGPTKGSFEVRGTGPDGASFEIVQFYLNDKWSQTGVQLDFGTTNIYVQRVGLQAGAVPAAVNGTNITWIEVYRELDVAANRQVELGEGVLNLTCS